MTFVIGRTGGAEGDRPTGVLGHYRAVDGSRGAPLHIDFDGPHAVLVVGKRGYGKSHTLGVLAEGLSRARGVAPVIVDPMGEFGTLAGESTRSSVPASIVAEPTVVPDALDPRSWCSLLGLSPESGPGGLVWQAAGAASTLDGMRTSVAAAEAADPDRRAAINHLDLAESWGVFDAGGLGPQDLASGAASVIDVSGLDTAPMNAVCRGVAETLYRARIENAVRRLPWLLVDEAHAFFDGVAASALRLLLTRGRAPGVSLVAATQRPSAVPGVAVSQSDLLISHRLTARDDVEALCRAQPTYMTTSIRERLPDSQGVVAIVDDSTETVHAAQIRQRDTPHGGGSPRASTVADSTDRGNETGVSANESSDVTGVSANAPDDATIDSRAGGPDDATGGGGGR